MAFVQGVLVQNDWLSSDIYYGTRRATLLTFREELAAEPRHDAKSRLVWLA